MSPLFSGTALQRLRLATGLVLFAFVLSHLVNHALGLVSLEAMTAMQNWRTAITRSTPGSLVLFGAMGTHLLINLWRIGQRRHWRMPLWEALQIGSGLLVPLLLIPHLIAMRVGHDFFDKDTSYAATIGGLWAALVWNQSLLIGLVWLHGCLGMHHWLKLARWYRQLQPLALSLAIAVPLLAMAGFSVAGRQQAVLAAAKAPAGDDYGRPAPARASRDGYGDAPAPAATVSPGLSLADLQERSLLAYLLLLAALPVGVVIRYLARRIRHSYTISYAGDRSVQASGGLTLLEISRANNIPHTSVCGGRARCSTCRVRVIAGAAHLPKPSDAELATLARIAAPPDVRLACQIRPNHDLEILQLVAPSEPKLVRASANSPEVHGVERTLAVMFIDVRGFTQFSQSKLPYDVVFVLNRLFAHFGGAIQAEGGWIDKYLGDGLMAVFGRDSGPETGSRQALAAARAINAALADANRGLISELGQPVQIGIGIHAGPMILGEIGHRDSAALTVIGRTVNAAARLEQATKEQAVQLIVSAETLRLASVPTDGLALQSLAVRGLDEPLTVLALASASDLPIVAAVSR